MPCLNEAQTLGTCIDKARGFLARAGVAGEVLIADNGSIDGSQAIAAQHAARVVSVAERGYGAALIGGIRAARGRFVVMGDADDSYDFTGLDSFLQRLQAGDQLVIGNRFKGGIAPGAMPPLNRYLGNPILSAIGRLFFGSWIGDFHCGLRGFERDAVLALDLKTAGMEFATEMVVKATFAGLKIGEVPTTLRPDGRDRPPHLRPWRDGWRHLRFLLMYAPAWLFLYPGLTLAGSGLLALLAVLPGPLVVGSAVFDVHTLVIAMGLVIIGSQMAIFFVLAKQFAINEQLLPASQRFRQWRRAFSLERLAIAGGLLVLLGCAGCMAAVLAWARADFGDLDYSWMMRLVVPSVTSLALGVQALLAGFLSSILDLNLRNAASLGERPEPVHGESEDGHDGDHENDSIGIGQGEHVNDQKDDERIKEKPTQRHDDEFRQRRSGLSGR